MIADVKYSCKYCSDSQQLKEPTMMTPLELEKHLIEDCEAFLKEIEKTHKKPTYCKDCENVKMEGHSCKRGKNTNALLSAH